MSYQPNWCLTENFNIKKTLNHFESVIAKLTKPVLNKWEKSLIGSSSN